MSWIGTTPRVIKVGSVQMFCDSTSPYIPSSIGGKSKHIHQMENVEEEYNALTRNLVRELLEIEHHRIAGSIHEACAKLEKMEDQIPDTLYFAIQDILDAVLKELSHE